MCHLEKSNKQKCSWKKLLEIYRTSQDNVSYEAKKGENLWNKETDWVFVPNVKFST